MGKNILRLHENDNGTLTRKPFTVNASDINFDNSGINTQSANAQSALSELYSEVSSVKQTQALNKKRLNILFIGNSLAQDAISYAPTVLKEIAPEIEFNFYLWYIGGMPLYVHWSSMSAENGKCQFFYKCENVTSWENLGAKTMDWICSQYEFDILCLQEYYSAINAGNEYVTRDHEYMDIINYIRARNNKCFKVVAMMHPPYRDMTDTDFHYDTLEQMVDDRYKYIVRGMYWQLQRTPCESIIPVGAAIYRAMKVPALDELGSNGHLSPDGCHAQEGLPCLIQAWVFVQWVLNLFGTGKSINNSQTRITSSNQSEMNVPGAHGAVITGTEEQNRLAMKVALDSIKEGKAIENDAFTYFKPSQE